MIQTKYFCDLCGEEVESSKSGTTVNANIILTFDNTTDKEYHGCQDCIENLNIYEIVAKLSRQATEAPPFESDSQCIRIRIFLVKLKGVSAKKKEA